MKKLLIWIIILGALAVGGYMYTQNGGQGSGDVPQISGGSVPEGWIVSAGDGLAFSYPEAISASYIGMIIWPPQGYLLGAGPISCVEAKTAIGQTSKRVIEGNTYCVTENTEGAAGTISTQYAYAFEKGGQVAALIFSLRYRQCANFPEPKKAECETERKTFSVDKLANTIAQSFKIGKLEDAPSTSSSTIPKGQ